MIKIIQGKPLIKKIEENKILNARWRGRFAAFIFPSPLYLSNGYLIIDAIDHRVPFFYLIFFLV